MKTSSWSIQTQGRVNNGSGPSGSDWLDEILGERALREGRTLLRYSAKGLFNAACTVQQLKDLLSLVGAKPYSQPLDSVLAGSWITDDSRIDIVIEGDQCWVNLMGLDRNEAELFRELLSGLKAPKPSSKRGAVFVLVTGRGGLQLQPLGKAGETFQEANYLPEVVESYRHVVVDLNRKNPCGRIAILDGPPGTGKTHMVRALLNEVPEATFILVQASSVNDLGSPDFIPVLMDACRFGTLILILEDADECLSTRSTSNVAAISSLLNFTDGIFGAMLDIRIIATTNVSMSDIDAAVVRPGRLCRHLHIGRHLPAAAQLIYNRLIKAPGSMGDFEEFRTYSLGDIYSKALKAGAHIVDPTDDDKEDGEDEADFDMP